MSQKTDRLKAQEAYTQIPNDRRETPNHVIRKRECPTSRTGQHDFSMRVPAPVGSHIKLFSCWACSEMSPRSKDRLAQYRADQKSLPTSKT